MSQPQFDDYMRSQISALLKLRTLTRCIKDDKIPCQIEDGLYLGSIGAANNRNELQRLNITHVLVVGTSLGAAYPDDFVYKCIQVADKQDVDIRQHFDECFDFIDEAKRHGGVLVHCFLGRSRSVTVIVGYLMKNRGMNLSQALEFVKNKRPRASPNSGFILQLRELENSLGGD